MTGDLLFVQADETHRAVALCTWQAALTTLSLWPLVALAVGAEAEPGDLLWRDWNLQQHLGVGLQGPCFTGVKRTTGAVRRGDRQEHGRAPVRGLPTLQRNGFMHRYEDREEQRHHQALMRRFHRLERRKDQQEASRQIWTSQNREKQSL